MVLLSLRSGVQYRLHRLASGKAIAGVLLGVESTEEQQMLEKQVTAHSRLLTCCELCCLLRHPRGCINISDNHLPCHGLHLQAAAVLATQRNVAVQLVHQHRPAIEMLCMELLDKKVRSDACHGVPSEQDVHVLMAQLCADGSTLCLSCGMVHHWLCTLPSPSAGAAC
jgi:hypothetical protein